MQITILFLLLILSNLCVQSCEAQSDGKNNYSNATTIVYRFGDSSVPPQYHRSFTITVTRSDAKLVVDSYGTIIKESERAITVRDFNEILETIRAARIASRASVNDDQGCSGGTSESLNLQNDKKALFDAHVYHCGGKDQGTLTGDIRRVKEKITALFPDLRKTE
jgi:hypothetical protein